MEVDLEAQTSSASAGPVGEGLTLAWSALSVVSTKRDRKRLLDGVSGSVGPGLTAIMGPSGAGKSTLLNALACRLDKFASMEGQARLNGAPYTRAQLKRCASYVMQDDLLSPHQTVEETLTFAAKLRLPPDTTAEERSERVEEVVAACRLQGCRHTLVGSPLRKGISGGERKRLSVAMELLTRPQLLFLDEPTSGLDAVTAHSLVAMLRELAEARGVTVLCTIHQPSSKIFSLFHNLILLQSGRIVFQGPPAEAVTVFARHGFPCPPLSNPADHLMEVIEGETACTTPRDDADASGSPGTAGAAGVSTPGRAGDACAVCGACARTGATPPRYYALEVSAAGDVKGSTGGAGGSGTGGGLRKEGSFLDGSFVLQEPPVIEFPEDCGSERSALVLRQALPWRRQYRVLLERCLKEQQRRWRTSVVQLLQSAFIAALIGGVFYQIGTTQASVPKRLPVLFFCCINQGVFGALAVINSFPAERVLSLRERAAGMYSASAYFLAKTTAEAGLYIVSPLLFSAVAYWMIGLQPLASKFWLFTCFMVLCQHAAVSLAQAVSALCRDVDTSVVVLPMFLEITRLFGGFFLPPSLQQTWMVVLDYISYVRYSYFGVALNELQGLVLTCTPQELAQADGVCPVTSGQQTIDRLDLGQLSIGANAGILVAYIVACRLIAFLGIRFLKS